MESSLEKNVHFTPIPHRHWKLHESSVFASTPLPKSNDESGYCTTSGIVESDSSSKLTPSSFPNMKNEHPSILSEDGSLESINASATSSRTTNPFWVKSCLQTVVPISGQEVGEEYVDFFKELGTQRSCENVVSCILSYLTPKELCTTTWVSKSWRKACLADRHAKQKVAAYLNECREHASGIEKENFSISKTPQGKHPRRNPFDNVQNIISTRDKPSVQDTKKMPPPKTRHQIFQEEANKLQAGERLRLCPRCSSPSRVDVILNRGICSRDSCVYDFCVRCFNEFHALLPCPSQREPITRSNNHLIGSKKSKRQLKRL